MFEEYYKCLHFLVYDDRCESEKNQTKTPPPLSPQATTTKTTNFCAIPATKLERWIKNFFLRINPYHYTLKPLQSSFNKHVSHTKYPKGQNDFNNSSAISHSFSF